MGALQWGIAVASLSGLAFFVAAVVALVMRKRRAAAYLAVAGYIFLWPIHLWFWQFDLNPRSPTGTGYIWNGFFQIAVAIIYLLIAFGFRRFRPWLTTILLVYIFSLLLQLFSYIYWSYGSTRNFSISLSHLDSFYFALGTLTTAGTGNISAISETARRIQTLQMGLDLVFVGIVVTLILARYSSLLYSPRVGSPRDNTIAATSKAGQPQLVKEPGALSSAHPSTIPHTDDERADAAIRQVVELMEAVFPEDPWEPASWPACAALAAQVDAAITSAEAYPQLAGQCGSLLRRLGVYLGATVQYAAARTALERALGITEAAYGLHHPDVARILDELGMVQDELGEREAARASHERALGIFEAAYGPDHPDVARTLGNLGNVQLQMSELEAARATYERALAIEEPTYGPDHPDVARTLVGLGVVQWQLGEREAARASEERALAIFEAAYGPDHPDVAKALGNLALFHRQLGELEAARATYERVLAIEEAAYGPDHPNVAMTLSDLSIVQKGLGERKAARASQERALAIFETAHGHDHPFIWKIQRLLIRMNGIAGFFRRVDVSQSPTNSRTKV
jgi:tetratricopeptide (TPR) repeat protein